MNLTTYIRTFLLGCIAFLSACAPSMQVSPAIQASPSPAVPVQLPAATVAPTAVPSSTLLPTRTPESRLQLSFDPAVYQDGANGFALDYPAGWTVDPGGPVGSRGSQAQLMSPGTSEASLAEGGSRVTLTIYTWDPKNDLAAYVAQRKIAWDSSGFLLVSENSRALSDGRDVVSFRVLSPEKQEAFFLFTTAGEKYLQIAGEGDLTLVEEIAGTLRPKPEEP